MHKRMIALIGILVLVLLVGLVTSPVTAGPSSELNVDGNTVLLDHFNGSVQGTGYGPLTYVASWPGLDQAAEFVDGTYVHYTLSGWYTWSPVYNPAGKEGTVEMWVRPYEYGSVLFWFNWFNTSTPPSSGYIFALSIGPDGRLYYNHWGSISGAPPAPPEGYNPVGSSVISLDEWTHVAATWGPTGTHLYVNGQEDGYTPFIAYPALNPTTYLYLNQWGQPGSGDKTIEELAISSVQRPAGEIQARFEQTRPIIMVDLDLDPDTLNLQNKGNYITAYIEFPEGVDPGQIQGDTILLEGVLPAEDGLIGDHDADGVPELMLKFSRPALIEYLSGTTGEVTLTVRGLLSDGVPFEGTDTIWVIQPNR